MVVRLPNILIQLAAGEAFSYDAKGVSGDVISINRKDNDQRAGYKKESLAIY
jgi:predicted metalloprotease